MRIYHYTAFSKIGTILGKRGEHTGLEPRRAIGGFSPNLENPKAIFGLLEPTPDNWVHNPHFPITWPTLVHDLQVMGDGALLIEADVDGKRDNAFVGERAHMEGRLYSEKSGVPGQFLHEDQYDAEKAFMTSMTPLEEYMAREQAREGFSLPEVVILNPVPSERIRVPSQQPLLEDELATTHGQEKKNLVNLITEGWAQHELAPWRQSYEGKHGSIEQQPRGKEAL